MGKTPANTDVRFWRDPDLPGVEARYSSYNEEAFKKHSHQAYSIGLIETGWTSFYLEGTSHMVGSGQIALMHPGDVHACKPDLDSNMTYRMFYVDPSWLKSVAEEVVASATGLPRFISPVVDDPPLFNLWVDLHEAIKRGEGQLVKESLLVQALAELISRHADLEVGHSPPENAAAVRMVREYLAEHFAEKVSLDRLSAVAFVSRYHLLRMFHKEMGMPPHAYQNQLRVDLGKKLLAQGFAISQAASEAGFADQSHFSRVFKQYTGATPFQYQAAVGSDG